MNSNGGIVRFGLFEIDLKKAELRKNGLRVKLQDQPFQVLRMLIERPGEVVTREEMRVALWPEGTFVDFDHSLNASINKLREALGDTASNPRFIETMPRRGYRFIAPAERASPALEPQSAARVSDGRRRMIAVSGGLALLAVAGAFATWRLATARGTPTAESKPLTSAPGMELQPSFSPDGNYVAYIAGPGRYDSDVYIKQIGSDSVRRLTSRAEKDVSPKWSPDGRHVAFIRLLKLQHPLAEAAVMTAPVLGGPERKVTDTSVTIANASVVEWFLDWFPDSENLIVVDGSPGGGAGALFGVNTRTGEKWRLTTPPTTGMGDLDPAVAPDGRSIVFTRHTGVELSAELYVLHLNSQLRPTGQPAPLRSPTPSRGPVWTPDGREILFASGPRHRMRLWRMRISPVSVPQPVPFGVEGTFPLSAAISKRWQLAYPVSQTETTIYRTKLLPDKRLESSSERFLRSSFFEHMPEYAPDAKRIAFVSNRSGSEQIWVSDSEGQNPHQLTFLAGNTEASWPRWSPDGRRLLFASANSVHVIALDGGPPSLLLRNVATTLSIAEWSPDGKWIYFSSDRTGREEVWKVKMGSSELNSEMLQVTKNGGGLPRVSPDGRFIYYAKGIFRPELWRVPVEGGDKMRVLDALCHNGSFTVVNEGVYFAPTPTGGPGTTRLMFLDTQTRSQSVVAPVSHYPGWGMSVSADGKSILRVEIDYNQESNLMIVENFR